MDETRGYNSFHRGEVSATDRTPRQRLIRGTYVLRYIRGKLARAMCVGGN